MANNHEVIEVPSDSEGEEQTPVVTPAVPTIKPSASVPPPSVAHAEEATTRPTENTTGDVGAAPTPSNRPSNLQDTPRKLYDYPEYAERYARIFSTLDEVTYRDPYKFSLKPPCWEKWSSREYLAFANYLELVDLKPLSRMLDKPVEEVYHMYKALVLTPFLDARHARSRGEEGMKDQFEFYKNCGMANRAWTTDHIRGEFEDVSFQTIHLILEESGIKKQIKLRDLTNEDLDYIKKNVVIEHRKILSGLSDGRNKHETEDGLPHVMTLKRKASKPELTTPRPEKQARLMESHTAPAKLRATPSAFPSFPNSAVPPATPSPGSPSLRKAPASETSAPSPIFEKWTDVGLEARFLDTAAQSVVLLARSNEEITLSRFAFNEEDKARLNAMKKDNHIDQPSWDMLRRSSSLGPENVFRPWTDQKVIARFEGVSPLSAHILLLSDHSRNIIKSTDLTDDDEAFLREHVSIADRHVLLGMTPAVTALSAAASATATPAIPQAGSSREQAHGDDAADNFDNGTGEEAHGADDTEHDTQSVRRDSGQTMELAAEAETGSLANEINRAQKHYEVVTGAPPRHWTDKYLLGKLEGIAGREVFLSLHGKQELHPLPMVEWTLADKEWLKQYLTGEQQKVLSRKAT
ncbi:hypothetical protein BST61_g7769 [Cercospora zeina]